MDESLDSTDTSTCLQEIRYGTYIVHAYVNMLVYIRTYIQQNLCKLRKYFMLHIDA